MAFVGSVLDIFTIPLPDILGQGTLQTVREVAFEVCGVAVVAAFVPILGDQAAIFMAGVVWGTRCLAR